MVKEYLEKLIRLPMAFFDRKVSSDLIQKIDDQNRIKNFLVSIPDTMFLTALGLLVFSGILIYYDWIIFLILQLGQGCPYYGQNSSCEDGGDWTTPSSPVPPRAGTASTRWYTEWRR